MNDHEIIGPPAALDSIARETHELGFNMGSEPLTGSLLRALAAAKPGGQFLELGTGTGIGTSWLLQGMDATSTLDSVEIDPEVAAIARRHLAADPRVTFHQMDGATFLQRPPRRRYDLIYADTWPGKFTHLEEALSLVKPGGFYFIDDLLPQPNWPEDHAPKVPLLIAALEQRRDFVTTKLSWATGLMIATRIAPQ